MRSPLWLHRIRRAGDIMHHGSPAYLLWVFGAVTIPVGLWLWNGLGPYFGLGPNARDVDRKVARAVIAILIVTVTIELKLNSR